MPFYMVYFFRTLEQDVNHLLLAIVGAVSNIKFVYAIKFSNIMLSRVFLEQNVSKKSRWIVNLWIQNNSS